MLLRLPGLCRSRRTKVLQRWLTLIRQNRPSIPHSISSFFIHLSPCSSSAIPSPSQCPPRHPTVAIPLPPPPSSYSLPKCPASSPSPSLSGQSPRASITSRTMHVTPTAPQSPSTPSPITAPRSQPRTTPASLHSKTRLPTSPFPRWPRCQPLHSRTSPRVADRPRLRKIRVRQGRSCHTFRPLLVSSFLLFTPPGALPLMDTHDATTFASLRLPSTPRR